jgi:hypothetical protein
VSRAQRAAARTGALLTVLVTALLAAAAAPAAPAACELVLAEHRSGRELARLPLDAARPTAQVRFTHSVLGTPVSDRYVWRAERGEWRAHLVEERFEGVGYGLPHAAGPGETLTRDGAAWTLRLDRVVHPLVVRPLPSQQMRVQVGDGPALLLGRVSKLSIELRVQGCDMHWAERPREHRSSDERPTE